MGEEEKSSQRGMVTAQSHCLYASAQSSQFLAGEYCADKVVLQGIWSSDLAKFSYRPAAYES